MYLNEWWALPDYEEVHWFNDAAEKATIKSILDGTTQARSWSDIQSTWPWCRLPKPRIPRVEKMKRRKVRPNIRLVRLLEANGMPRKEAIQKAMQLLETK